MKPRKESPEAYARWVAKRREKRRRERERPVVIQSVIADATDKASVELLTDYWGDRVRADR